MAPILRMLTALLAAAIITASCGDGGSNESGEKRLLFTIGVRSPEFVEGGRIPLRFSCENENVPPPLAFRGIPESTKELALIIEDLDSEQPPFFHWALFRIPPTVTEIQPGVIPEGAVEGQNSGESTTYIGPCPPGGDPPHRYQFTLYALREPIAAKAGTSAGEVKEQAHANAIAAGRLTGLFGRS